MRLSSGAQAVERSGMHDPDLEDFLAHYGVKGMKWGVRKSRDVSVGVKSSGPKKVEPSDYGAAFDDFYKGKPKSEIQHEGQKKLNAQATASFPSSKKPDSKTQTKSDEESTLRKGLTTEQKVLIGVGAAAAAGVLIYYGKQKYDLNVLEKASAEAAKKKQASDLQFAQTKALKAVTREETASEWSRLFSGSSFTDAKLEERPPGLYDGFYLGLRSKKALERPGFTIPQDTVFQRLSDNTETGEGYAAGAYSTFLTNDKAKYGGSPEFGEKAYAISYRAKGPVKVPSTKTVLDTIKSIKKNADGSPLSDSQVVSLYHEMSGGDWKTHPTGSKLIGSLKKAGYSAIVDDMDAGYLGDLPVVFFGEATNVTANRRAVGAFEADRRRAVPVAKVYA